MTVMNMYTLISVLVSGSSVLSGSLAGRRLLTKLIEVAQEPAQPTPFLLDFKGISTGTASFLRESVLALKSYCRQRNSNLFPVAANLTEILREELEFCLRAQNDAMICCELDSSGRPFNAALVGSLDPKIHLAFSSVQTLGEVDAATVWQQHRSDEPIKVNAWNNRLAALSALGVIIEEVRGRSKVYRPIFKEHTRWVPTT